MKRIISLAAVSFFCLSAITCSEKAHVKIGFAGTLSGKYSDFGISARDGAILAVEEINTAGGVNGSVVELLVNDDMNDPQKALSGDIALINQGVVAIIGHMVSSMSLAAADGVSKMKTVLISPTTSTVELDKKDDYFLRIMSSTEIESKEMARFAADNLKVRSVNFILDQSNQSYSRSLKNSFVYNFAGFGGSAQSTIEYNSREKNSFLNLAVKLLRGRPEAVYLIANSQDSAILCQQIRKINSTVPILICSWAQTADFLIYGGKAVEGVYFSHHFFPGQDDRAFHVFRDKYYRRFKREPEFSSVYAYDSANVIFQALIKNRDPEKLKETILGIRNFEGASGKFTINKYGDTVRHFSLLTIKNGKFVKIK